MLVIGVIVLYVIISLILGPITSERTISRNTRRGYNNVFTAIFISAVWRINRRVTGQDDAGVEAQN